MSRFLSREDDGDIIVHDIPLMLVPGSYVCEEAPRFGEKLAFGDLKYADFTPNETGFPVTSWHGGFGLRRYSDYPSQQNQYMPNEQYSTGIPPMVLENENVIVDEAGVAYLAPMQVNETLPFDVSDTAGSPIWIGEYSGKLVAVAGNAVFERDITIHPNIGTWTRKAQLPAVAVCVALFGGKVLVGFGAAATARVTTDLTTWATAVKNDAATSIYVWATTADKASIYVAGGTATTDFYKVMDSVDAATGFAGTVTCGDSNSKITGLAPGGNIDILYIGKEDCFGCIDFDGNFRVLVELDSKAPTNCKGMRWWMGSGANEQRGPLIVIFPRERSLWAYQPSSEVAGKAENITPWNNSYVRPLNVRGRTTAVRGSARWLYYAVQNGAGKTWILRRDARNGVTSIFLSLGTVSCQYMAITTLYGTNPLLFYGRGNNVGYVILPLDGESFLSDSACRFCASGTVTLPDADLGFPDEQKVLYSERVVGDNISGNRTITVEYSLDGGAYTSLGIVTVGPTKDINYPDGTVCKRWGRRLTLATNDATLTPQLRGIVSRVYLNTRLLKQWTFQAVLPPGFMRNRSDPVLEEYQIQRQFWLDRKGGRPVTFTDRYGDTWNVKILKVMEKEIIEDETKERTIQFGMVLLESKRAGSTWVWGDGSKWGSPYLQWG